MSIDRLELNMRLRRLAVLVLTLASVTLLAAPTVTDVPRPALAVDHSAPRPVNPGGTYVPDSPLVSNPVPGGPLTCCTYR